MILIPAKDIVDVADVIRRVRPLPGDEPLYVAVTDDQIELREGTNVTYGARHFTPVVP